MLAMANTRQVKHNGYSGVRDTRSIPPYPSCTGTDLLSSCSEVCLADIQVDFSSYTLKSQTPWSHHCQMPNTW